MKGSLVDWDFIERVDKARKWHNRSLVVGTGVSTVSVPLYHYKTVVTMTSMHFRRGKLYATLRNHSDESVVRLSIQQTPNSMPTKLYRRWPKGMDTDAAEAMELINGIKFDEVDLANIFDEYSKHEDAVERMYKPGAFEGFRGS